MNLTDSSGSVTNSYSYSTFGEIVSQTGTAPNLYQFSTKLYNFTTGLVHFGFRYYDPSVGRFITVDPLGMVNGPNLYAYCINSPVNFIDPSGLCIEDILRKKLEGLGVKLDRTREWWGQFTTEQKRRILDIIQWMRTRR